MQAVHWPICARLGVGITALVYLHHAAQKVAGLDLNRPSWYHAQKVAGYILAQKGWENRIHKGWENSIGLLWMTG